MTFSTKKGRKFLTLLSAFLSYTQTFPGTFVIGFKVGGDGLKFNGVELDLNDRVDLDRCSVYGAIKYKGRWLGARIIKDRD